MDPTKKTGKIREQVDRENITRRKYSEKHGYMVENDAPIYYSPNFINNKLNRAAGGIDEAFDPYKYTGHGDSYFVSKEMHRTLVATCRCGRPKTNGHIIKCIQKVKEQPIESTLINNHELKKATDVSGGSSDGPLMTTLPSNDDSKSLFIGKVPQTSNVSGAATLFDSPYSDNVFHIYTNTVYPELLPLGKLNNETQQQHGCSSE